jgi:hypothetical protein
MIEKIIKGIAVVAFAIIVAAWVIGEVAGGPNEYDPRLEQFRKDLEDAQK